MNFLNMVISDKNTIKSIIQVDGFEDILLEEIIEVDKTVFGVNCEFDIIVGLINFFRSFNFLWLRSDLHQLCNVKKIVSFVTFEVQLSG